MSDKAEVTFRSKAAFIISSVDAASLFIYNNISSGGGKIISLGNKTTTTLLTSLEVVDESQRSMTVWSAEAGDEGDQNSLLGATGE
jgi:hypothetical protein